MFSFIVTLVLLIVLVIAWASLSICANVFLKSKCKIKSKNTIALTFDDGPHPQYTPDLLDILNKLDVKATFFVIGHKAEQYPEIVKRIANEGHTLGHHSYYHKPKWTWFSTQKISKEIQKTIDLLEEISGERCIYFRPPFGVTNPNIAKAIKQLHLISIGWSLRSYDTTYTPKMVVNKVIKKAKPGDIILMHDHLSSTHQSVETIVTECRRNGLKFTNFEKSN